ncbi:MAG: GGDEF domain-containing protein [Treponema sp.]|nr:GGDEF domain-containing protein [Treponema sp.]
MSFSSIKKALGLEKTHPEIQFFLDSANLSIAVPGSFLVMLVELFAFVMTFFHTFGNEQEAAQWLLYHRSLYVFLFLAATQLFIYAVYHKRTGKPFSRLKLDASILFFIFALLVFANFISINDYIKHEQILVFITIELFVSCFFMIKPYLAIILITIPFSIFYYLMATTAGVSNATKINYPVIMIFFILVNVVRYQQYLKVAENNVINHELADKLRNASRYDFLTGLKNRNALNMDFENPKNPNLNSTFIIMVTDIDDFKIFNDSHGHNYGDEILNKFATILQNNFEKKHCYRYGGDEYLIVLPEIPEQDFLQKIKTCKEKISSDFNFSGGYTRGFVSSSKDLYTLITKADQNLYKAKGSGKNQVIGSFDS